MLVVGEGDSLPPGPPLAPAIQTAIWFRRAQWLMSQCAARYGETFTLRIVHEDPWVVLSNPLHVRQVFTGDPRVFHAGEGNRILLPVVGEHSVLLLDEASHLEQRRLLLPPFHGPRMQRYGALMAEVAAAEIERWPRGEPYRLRPRMQALTLEIILRAVFGLEPGERLRRLSTELRRLLDVLTNPRMLLLPIVLGPDKQPGTYTWIPFGGGIRRCLGGAFAQFEMGVVLSELVRRRTLSPARPQPERVFRRAVTETPRRDAEVVIA